MRECKLGNKYRLTCHLAPERLDLNLTSAFIGIAKQTATVWSAKFMQDAASKDKKRAPFLPFLLRNKTGIDFSYNQTILCIYSNNIFSAPYKTCRE